MVEEKVVAGLKKRTIQAVVTIEVFVDLPPGGDPDGCLSDAEAVDLAISAAIGQKKDVWVFGPEREPAVVFVDHMDIEQL